MTVNWELPVETCEDPPRPVRVLATDLPPPRTVALSIEGASPPVHAIQADYTVVNGFRLRNVAPPKSEPVLREAWVWWNSHGQATVSLNKEWCVHQRTVERGVYARVAVMSDGSPVPGEDSPLLPEYMQMEADRDHWRTKAEALQAEVKHREKMELNALRQRDAMRPVVDAAVEWVNTPHVYFDNHSLALVIRGYMSQTDFGLDTWHSCGQSPKKTAAERPAKGWCSTCVTNTERCQDCRQPQGDVPSWYSGPGPYQSQPKKTAAEAVANVAEMMGPVKNCTTCGFNAPIQVGAPCVKCHYASEWRPRHD